MSNVEKKAAGGLATKQIVLILGALVIVAAAVVAVVYLMRGNAEPQATPPPEGAKVITEANVKEIVADVDEKVAAGMFETHMNTTWTFPEGKAASNDAVMGNSPNNNYAFYFTVTLSDTGETVFTSGLLPVGTQIAEIKLEKDLEAGTYPASVGINLVDDNGDPVKSNVGFNITLIVQN